MPRCGRERQRRLPQHLSAPRSPESCHSAVNRCSKVAKVAPNKIGPGARILQPVWKLHAQASALGSRTIAPMCSPLPRGHMELSGIWPHHTGRAARGRNGADAPDAAHQG